MNDEQESIHTEIALLKQKHDQLKDKYEEIYENMVTKDQFLPVRTIIYGMVGVVLIGALTALLALIIKT